MSTSSPNADLLTLDAPILGLDDDFPSVLWVLHHVGSGKYGCYSHKGVHGLACFGNKQGALGFSEFITGLDGMVALEVSFDEAREIAKSRPLPVVSLMLLDRMDDPKIHYVR